MLAETKEPLVELIVSAFGEDVTQSKVHPAKTLVCYSDVRRLLFNTRGADGVH